MVKKQRIQTKSGISKKSAASKKGWITRRKNQKNQPSKKSASKPSRTLSLEKLKKLQKAEKTRNLSRLKAQKKGRSLVSDKPKLNSKKPMRPARKQSKKRASIK